MYHKFKDIPKAEYTDEELLLAARVGHSVMNAVGDVFGHVIMPQWDFCPTNYKEDILRKTGRILRNAASCRTLHNRWVKARLADGWTLGERNDELKQHPHLKEYNDLPADVRAKAKAFRAAIMPFRKNLGPGFHVEEE